MRRLLFLVLVDLETKCEPSTFDRNVAALKADSNIVKCKWEVRLLLLRLPTPTGTGTRRSTVILSKY
jgi:hypothetical protein